MRVYTKPIYSRLAEPDAAERLGIKLPAGWQSMSRHQVETYRLLTDPNIDVIFNTAMTGDGKSLAAYLPLLQSGQPILALYPTNELARDQDRQVNDYIQQFHPPYDPRIGLMNSELLASCVRERELVGKCEGIARSPTRVHYRSI